MNVPEHGGGSENVGFTRRLLRDIRSRLREERTEHQWFDDARADMDDALGAEADPAGVVKFSTSRRRVLTFGVAGAGAGLAVAADRYLGRPTVDAGRDYGAVGNFLYDIHGWQNVMILKMDLII